MIMTLYSNYYYSGLWVCAQDGALPHRRSAQTTNRFRLGCLASSKYCEVLQTLLRGFIQLVNTYTHARTHTYGCRRRKYALANTHTRT